MVLAALLVAEAMNLIDATIVQVAAPTIHVTLGGSPGDVQWLGAAYTLPFALLLIPGGRLGDILGRKRVFLIGVAGFGLASAACALAPNMPVLIGWRAVQGAAPALVIPQTFGLIRALFDGPELSRALGSIGPVMRLAAICGPALGALVTDADLAGSSWRAAFLINIPLTAGVLACRPVMRENAAAEPPAPPPAAQRGTAARRATLGTAALGTVFLRGLGDHDPVAATAALEQAFWIALALTGLTAVAALLMAAPRTAARTHPVRRVSRVTG
jgi:MFS family permease